MTKLEFASAWQHLKAIREAYAVYVDALEKQNDARVLVTDEMFLSDDRRTFPEWDHWSQTATAQGTALNLLLQAIDDLDCSDVGELLRETDGPYTLDVDPDDEPATRSHSDLDAEQGPTTDVQHSPEWWARRQDGASTPPEDEDDDGSQENAGDGGEGSEGNVAGQEGGGQNTPGD